MVRVATAPSTESFQCLYRSGDVSKLIMPATFARRCEGFPLKTAAFRASDPFVRTFVRFFQDSISGQWRSSRQRLRFQKFWHRVVNGCSGALLDSLAVWRVGFRTDEAGPSREAVT